MEVTQEKSAEYLLLIVVSKTKAKFLHHSSVISMLPCYNTSGPSDLPTYLSDLFTKDHAAFYCIRLMRHKCPIFSRYA